MGVSPSVIHIKLVYYGIGPDPAFSGRPTGKCASIRGKVKAVKGALTKRYIGFAGPLTG